jgi:hypothetical protein
MQEFFEWLQESLGPPSILAVVLLTLACLLIIIISYLVGEPTPTTNNWLYGVFWLSLLSELSKLVLAAIVTGAVLKTMVVGGFFERAVANIIFEERGLEILSGDRHTEIWRSLTARIYAPSFRSSHRVAGDIQKLYDKISLSSGKLIEYRKDFYVQRVTKELTFEFVGDGPSTRATDQMWADIVPFDPSKEVVWVSKVTPGAGGKIGDFSVNDVLLTIQGEDAARRTKETTNDELKLTYYMRGASSYRITRTRETIWNFTDDPIFSFTSPYITESGTFKISNNIKGKRILIQQIGFGQLFNAPPQQIIASGQAARMEVASVLLPNQGFQVIIIT